MRHDALIYSTDVEYLDAIGTFAREGLERGEAVLVAVPGERHALIRDALGPAGPDVELVDMRRQGQNPARILPFVQGFLDSRPGADVRFVGEPIWSGRSSAEIVEGHRHEALINLAFADRSVHIVCPYDAARLSAEVLAEAERTHSALVGAHGRCDSGAYDDPLVVYRAEDNPLPDPGGAVTLALGDGLCAFRRRVADHALAAGLDPERIAALALAAHEAAANTVVHGGRDGTARIWHDERTLVCEVADSGRIEDPLVGRRSPPAGEAGARGVWLINQLCDLVELRSSSSGTVVRMHMRLAPSPGS